MTSAAIQRYLAIIAGRWRPTAAFDIGNWSDKVVIMRTLAATEFKAHCLAVLDRVSRTGEEVTITKHGRPVARLLPPIKAGGGSPLRHPLHGTVAIVGDIVGPAVPATKWAALRAEPEWPKSRSTRRRRAR